jgi:hypothetical protein
MRQSKFTETQIVSIHEAWPPLSNRILPRSLLVTPLPSRARRASRWPESVSHCARPKRGVCDRALREHRRQIKPPSPSLWNFSHPLWNFSLTETPSNVIGKSSNA